MKLWTEKHPSTIMNECTRKRTRAEAGLYGNLEQLQDPKFKGKRRHFNEGEVP